MLINISSLPCIFQDILACQHINFDDPGSWSGHVIEHFGPSGPPPHALCIFCDKSFEDDNAATCWNVYLDHINEHFKDGRALDKRPDFRVLKYLWEKGIITDDGYDFFCGGSERPKVPGLIPLDYEPEEIIAKKRAEGAASNRIIVSDPRRRRRDQQRPTRGKKTASTVIHARNETS